MAEEAQVKVELDTAAARKKLRELIKEAEDASDKINKGGKGGKGKKGGLGGDLAKGFGIGAGFGLGKRLAGAVGVFSTVGDVLGDAFVGTIAKVDLSLEGVQARARQGAREETIQNMAFITGLTGDTQSAKAYFNTVLDAKHMPLQQGASAINIATGGSRAIPEDQKTAIDKFLESITGEIESGFDRVLSAIGG